MNMQEIKELAKNLDIKISKKTKRVLIQEIQETEGNTSCYGSGEEINCGEMDCLWRDDCFAEAKKSKAA